MEKYDHFEKYEWIGLFWAESRSLEPEKTDEPKSYIEFPGKLYYSVEDGAQLEFMCPMGTGFNKSRYIHGALENGEKCTLFGLFEPERFGFHSGEISIYRAKISLDAVIFGVHVSTDDKFDGISLDLTNFQEFCHPQGFRDWAKYSEEPIFTEIYDDMEISLVNRASFKNLEFNFETLFHSKNKEAELELKAAIKNIIEKYKDEEILTRTDIGWELLLKNKNGITIDDAIKNTMLLEQLLSLLLFSPVRRTKLNILVRSQEQQGRFKSLSTLTSLFDISKYKKNVLQRKLSHLHLHINMRNINFGKVIKSWFLEHEKFQDYAFSLSHEYGRTTEPEIRAKIIVSLAQIESIAHGLGKKSSEKYDAPISHYDKGQIVSKLKESLKVSGKEKIGTALSELRSDIAHFGRPVTRTKRMSLSDLHMVQRCLSFIICSSIYDKLGIPAGNIVAFQDRQLPKPIDFSKYFPEPPIREENELKQ
ncbi:hypothetical protein [Aeromonas caviae]|uniref:ApeA N-terminal domain 1-containing protein n=1 Tax=Aeromonas caviae TaxID=648 RepID=UPI00237F733F|nr:hypothetical protein [Aeromonas caviae]WDV28150.1 hypothetical protein PVK35_20725 [Aeromonas caviae]